MKFKLKTRSSAVKRFQLTKTGKILHRKAFSGHLLEKKSSKRKRNLKSKIFISLSDKKMIRLMLSN